MLRIFQEFLKFPSTSGGFLVLLGYPQFIHISVVLYRNRYICTSFLMGFGVVDMPKVVVMQLQNIMNSAYQLGPFLGVIIC